nr:uncharacterized protein LOC113714153 [Coffea arabica]
MELGPNLFQFNIPNLEDKKRVVEGGPWLIDNQVLVLRRWSERIEENYGAFVTAPIWVQLWNLPVHWLTKEVGRKIGAAFKEVKEVIIPQTGGKGGRHLKLLALVDLSTPLLRGTVMQIADVFKWVVFKYERCPDFCYSCGVVGHSERSYKEQSVTIGRLSENQYGPWMRAGSIRSPSKERLLRTELNKDRRYWKFQDGEMVERKRNRIKIGDRLLEFLENTNKKNRSKQLLVKEGEEKRLGKLKSSPPNRLDDSEAARVIGTTTQQMVLEKQRSS